MHDDSQPIESFEGESNVVIDEKGRFGMPGRYREQLDRFAGQAVITLAFTPISALSPKTGAFKRYRGLSILPPSVWHSIKGNLEQRERFDPLRAAFSVFVASALTCKIDGQRRILVPPALRQFLTRKEGEESKEGEEGREGEEGHGRLKLVGVGERFELWREDIWEALRMEMLGAAARTLKTDRKSNRSERSAGTRDLPL